VRTGRQGTERALTAALKSADKITIKIMTLNVGRQKLENKDMTS